MKKLLLILFGFILSGSVSAQDNLFTTESFIVKITGTKLIVEELLERKIVFRKDFIHPAGYVIDLDNDGNVEFLVNDCRESEGKNLYSVFIYNTVDSFYLIDSILSGLKEPYYTFSDEINEIILITGSPDFDTYNSDEIEMIYSPLICWGFHGNEFGLVNDQLYDIFINENEKNIDFVEEQYKAKGKNCNTANMLRGVIASIFINYYSADEKAVADKALDELFVCDNKARFKEEITKLF
ncbi:MAG: hypothetical protein C4539_05915 [Ignavibacteriales bacterium]|nr:MAG: hypothetical protein C4539_05915 [Ignavibacteriales bacterium]